MRELIEVLHGGEVLEAQFFHSIYNSFKYIYTFNFILNIFCQIKYVRKYMYGKFKISFSLSTLIQIEHINFQLKYFSDFVNFRY